MKKFILGLFAISFSWFVATSNAKVVQAGYIYVDGASQSTTTDGSDSNPYKDIASALSKAAENSKSERKLYVKKGTYASGDLNLPESTEILGEDRDATIIDFSASDKSSLTMGKRSNIEKLTVKGGNYGVIVPKKSKVTIKNVKVTDSKRVGIWIKSGKNSTVYSATIKDSLIKDNDGKGIFVEQSYLYFYNNEVSNNGEEGLDLRSQVKGKIYDSTFKDNSEGGMELEIRGVKLDIRNNDLKSNEASGMMLNNRTNKGGSISLRDNEISGNNHYGIRCGGTRAWTSGLWKKTMSMKSNDLDDNDSGDIDNACASN